MHEHVVFRRFQIYNLKTSSLMFCKQHEWQIIDFSGLHSSSATTEGCDVLKYLSAKKSVLQMNAQNRKENW